MAEERPLVERLLADDCTAEDRRAAAGLVARLIEQNGRLLAQLAGREKQVGWWRTNPQTQKIEFHYVYWSDPEGRGWRPVYEKVRP